MFAKKRIYLDYAAATPVDGRVAKAMWPFAAERFANPSSIHAEGVQAKKAVTEARTGIARILNVRPEEIIFTASGTEADNLAIGGVVMAARKKGITAPHIVTTNIEHPAILETCRALEEWGIKVSYVPVESNGIIDVKKIAAAVTPETVLVTVQLANSEIGTIQPLREIARAITEYKIAQNKKDEPTLGQLNYPYFHTDASQGPNFLDVNFQKYGVDMMTLDAAKIYGPKGVGLLAVKRQVTLEPQILGGGQEAGRRAGTENVPAIIGLAEALKIADQMREKEATRMAKLQEYFIQSLEKLFPINRVILNGDRNKRLPNNVNIGVGAAGKDAEFMVLQLDNQGIAASAGSACTNLSTATYSYVVEAISPGLKSSSIRFSFGRGTNRKELDLTLRILRSIIES